MWCGFVEKAQVLDLHPHGHKLVLTLTSCKASGKWFNLCIRYHLIPWASLVAQRLKHLPAMRETRVWSLGQEDPLEKEMATHFSILAWEIPWMEEPSGLQSTGSQRVGHDWAISLSDFTLYLVMWVKWYFPPKILVMPSFRGHQPLGSNAWWSEVELM